MGKTFYWRRGLLVTITAGKPGIFVFISVLGQIFLDIVLGFYIQASKLGYFLKSQVDLLVVTLTPSTLQNIQVTIALT